MNIILFFALRHNEWVYFEGSDGFSLGEFQRQKDLSG